MSNRKYRKSKENASSGKIIKYIVSAAFLICVIVAIFLIQDAVIFTADGMEFIPEMLFGNSNTESNKETTQTTMPHATTAVLGDSEIIQFSPKASGSIDIESMVLPISNEGAGRIGRLLTFSEYAVPDFASTVRVLTNSGTKIAVFDVKASSGKLSYASSLSLAKRANAVASATEDYYLRDAIKRLQKANIKVVAKLSCLADSRLADAQGDMVLRDEAGLPCHNKAGFALLNPENSELREYLVSVAEEVVAMGFDTLVLDDLAFPSNVEGESEALLSLMAEIDNVLGNHELALIIYPASQYVQDEIMRQSADALWAYQKGLGADYYLDSAGVLFRMENQ